MRSLRFSAGFTSMLAGAVLAGGGCSGEVAPAKGQLMVVLQSDMAIPKDITRAKVLITVHGTRVFDETYVANAAGDLKLPGTIAVVAGEKDAEQVVVQVIGIDKDGEAVTFSKALTTMPRSRMATLRMPMQWLCSGQVVTFGDPGDPVYASSCSDTKDGEQSCLAGSCKSITIDEASLPLFNAPDVFGGGEYPGDPSGECFDVQGCFKNGIVLSPDLDPDSDTYCQAAINVPAGADLNFAINTGPKGAGVCDDDNAKAPCFVVLDQSESFGWTPLETDGEPMVGSNDGTGGRGGSAGKATGGSTGTSASGGAGSSASGGAPMNDGKGGSSTGTGGQAPAGAGSSSGPIAGNGFGGNTSSGGTSGAGTAGAGTGGKAGGGGGAAPIGGSGTGGSGTGGMNAGYITSGSWHGHTFTAKGVGSTINPTVPTETDFPVCVSGTVAGAADSSNYAVLGFNLNQSFPNGTPLTVSPMSSTGGVDVQIANFEGTPLRLQLNGPNAASDPLEQWCAPILPTGGITTWDSFSYQCWTGEGAAYPIDQAITSVEVVVPGSTVPTPFDFCVDELAEAFIAPKLRAPLQPQSIRPPGLHPLQEGGGDVAGTVVVQFPTAVCDKINDDPTLLLTATAACDAKTEKTPLCGPWSTASSPQVPDPDIILEPMTPMSEGGAGGMSGEPPAGSAGETSAAGGTPNAGAGGDSGIDPVDCQSLPHAVTSPLIAGFDTQQPEPGIELVDGRMGFAFSVGYGTCQPASLLKTQPGVQSTRYLHFQGLGSCSMTQGNAVTLVVPFNATGFANVDRSMPPDAMCVYSANSYTGISFWAKSQIPTSLQVAVLTPGTVPVDDPVPGGSCVSNCAPRALSFNLTTTWTQYNVPFAQLEVSPNQLLAVQFQSTAKSENMFDIDQISFIGGQ